MCHGHRLSALGFMAVNRLGGLGKRGCRINCVLQLGHLARNQGLTLPLQQD